MAEWLWFLLLSLASWRVYRLLAEDTILDKPRRKLLRLGSWQEEDGEDNVPDEYRNEWAIFLTCPYCAGFWISGIAVTLYAIFEQWDGVLSFTVWWFSASALVALLAKADEKLNA